MTLRNRNVEDRAVQQNFEALDAVDNALAARATALEGRATALEGKVWIPTVVALPGAPVDGQDIFYLADAANGVAWHLKYRAAEPGALKWYFVGGPPLRSEVMTQQTLVASGVYGVLPTAGPSVTVPLAGDYVVGLELRAFGNTAVSGCLMSYDIGATPAVDADALNVFSNAVNETDNGARSAKKTLAAATALVSKYKTSAGTGTYANRVMQVTPIRVG